MLRHRESRRGVLAGQDHLGHAGWAPAGRGCQDRCRRCGKSRPPIRRSGISITGAPRIADGRIFIGEAGSEFEERGYLACYSADTGKELWRWWTVPGDPAQGFEQPELAMAAKTWGGQWWKTGGGGTPWDGITYDPTTGYVYIGTGNGAPWPAETAPRAAGTICSPRR